MLSGKLNARLMRLSLPDLEGELSVDMNAHPLGDLRTSVIDDDNVTLPIFARWVAT